MKRTMLIAILTVFLGAYITQAHAYDVRKYGPVLDGEEQINNGRLTIQ